jgi:hypothetical protein
MTPTAIPNLLRADLLLMRLTAARLLMLPGKLFPRMP